MLVAASSRITIEEKARAAQIKKNVRNVDEATMQTIFAPSVDPVPVTEETTDAVDILEMFGSQQNTQQEETHE